jgi:ABC-type transporter Mla subunit MlaD
MHALPRLVPVAALTAALAIVAAGCGGSSESAQEKWANDVCTQFVTWSKQMKTLGDDAKNAIQSPSASTVSQLQSDAQQAVDATKTLKANLSNLPPAPGANGQSVKSTFTTFANNVNQAIAQLKTSAEQLSSSKNLGDAATALSAAAGQLSSFSTQTQNAIDTAKQTSSDMQKGFENASSCKDLQNQTSSS